MKTITKNISEHAKERINKRFKISSDKVLFLLENNFGKIIGRSYDFRVHYLIWSYEDQGCIILINNSTNEYIVTALNEEMYLNTYPEMINTLEKNKQKIINLMIYNDLESKKLWKSDERPLLIYAEHCSNERIHLTYLSMWKDIVYDYGFSSLAINSEFWGLVESKIIEKNISINNVLSIKVKVPDGPFFEIEP